LKLIAITFIGGTIAGLVLALITVAIVVLAVRKKLDPDNVTTPALATIGDTITVLCLLGVVAVLANLW
jgi:mgtE-like transporter